MRIKGIFIVLSLLFCVSSIYSLDYAIYVGKDNYYYLYSASDTQPDGDGWEPVDPEKLKGLDTEKAVWESNKSKTFADKNVTPSYNWKIKLKDRLEAYAIIEKMRSKNEKPVVGEINAKVTETQIEAMGNTNEAMLSELHIETSQVEKTHKDYEYLKSVLIPKYARNFEIQLSIVGKAKVKKPAGLGEIQDVDIFLDGTIKGTLVNNRASLYYEGNIYSSRSTDVNLATNISDGKKVGTFKGSISFLVDPDTSEMKDGVFFLYGMITIEKDTRINIIKDGKISGKNGEYTFTANTYDRNYQNIGQLTGNVKGKVGN